VIQLSGIATVYTSFFMQWQYMQWIMVGLLALMMVAVMMLVRPVRGPMFIPLLGIDWIGSLLWGVFMLCFTFICVYGNYFDWWDAAEIRGTVLLGLAVLAINLWRATFLRHPYISFQAMKNRNVVRATIVYLLFYTMLATEHVFEHTYAASILGFDETNLIDLNWYVFAGIIAGVVFTYLTFALRKWGYKTMTIIGFSLAACYLAWFYFGIGFGVEKEALFVPLFIRGTASVIISIVFLTSIVQSGLPFTVFPQALTINGFTGAVVGAALGPAIVGEWFSQVLTRNINATGMIPPEAMVLAMKEIYGWLLIMGLTIILVIAVSYGQLRPFAIFPKWKNIRRTIRRLVRER
jgi:hypothetical protein